MVNLELVLLVHKVQAPNSYSENEMSNTDKHSSRLTEFDKGLKQMFFNWLKDVSI